MTKIRIGDKAQFGGVRDVFHEKVDRSKTTFKGILNIKNKQNFTTFAITISFKSSIVKFCCRYAYMVLKAQNNTFPKFFICEILCYERPTKMLLKCLKF